MSALYKLKNFEFLFALSVGLLAFIFITGGKILSPTSIDWLMDGDPASQWLGWEFFRNSPIFQWPLGSNPNYGMEIGSSVVFSDSIPLFALIFKPFNSILPNPFQYIGLWVLLCFLLQSLFAWKLLSLFTKDRWLPLIGCAFFVLAPACLWRLHGHYALFGQWVILAALYLYFAKKFSIFYWSSLLLAATLIHAYLIAMIMAVWLADLVQRRLLNETNRQITIQRLFIGLILTVIAMWAIGYFMLNGGIESDGFGFYRMNVLSLIDPKDNWSHLLRDQNLGGGDYEGFNYLGVGMIGLSFIAISTLLNRNNYPPLPRPKMLPITILFICFFFFAISNRIAVGSHEIFSYTIPFSARYFTNTFRSSGRFFWPAYYIVYLAIFYLIFTRVKTKVAVVMCAGMLFIQIVDSSRIYDFFRNKFMHPSIYTTPIKSPLWDDIAKKYKKIIYVLPRNIPDNWMPLSHFAAMHQMEINIGYFARVDPNRVNDASTSLSAKILEGRLDPDSIYIFENDLLWKFASDHLSTFDVSGNLDGLHIIAPNLKQCKSCVLESITYGH